MAYNRLIGNAPILIPLLIIAFLVLVTWYRPALHVPTARASLGPGVAQGLPAGAPQNIAKPAR